MRRFAFIFYLTFHSILGFSQENEQNNKVITYHPTAERINDLVHTKLEVSFDYAKAQMNGNAWLTLKPHFYATDSLELDAKGMDIKTVALLDKGKNLNLKYDYDGNILSIHLNRLYHNTENYTIYIKYVAKPNEYQGKGSAAITDAKGLYFINPKGEEKNKPTQIWTQGETESNSVWMPTIDKPNQKMTDEIIMTVPAKYVTLSNGILAGQKLNQDGTRTDDWKMDLPHAPYLVFMGVGDFSIIKDKYKNKEVSYYVEKEYAPVARRIFGHTPEMIAYFSKITGVDYPWQKYAQMVGRDYVSGAMENTTATLHQEQAQQDARELSEDNRWEDDIAHELFHQWFGDYVTTESWSNITLNESFANYSEYLWDEYKFGKDAADAKNYTDMQGYLMSGSEKKDLVRFYYKDKEDLFDAVSYNKGGRILHMLRNYVGDSAFFKALNLYLTRNKFTSAEAQQLRLAFEEVTGKDLNWFWNQWYYGSGHPQLTISTSYDPSQKRSMMIVEQTQAGGKVFQLPVAVDVWTKTGYKRYPVWINQKTDTFYFQSQAQPELINFDAEKYLLVQKKEQKSLEEYAFQLEHAHNYLDRREAMDAALKSPENEIAYHILQAGLKDPFAGLRNYVTGRLNLGNAQLKETMEPYVAEMAKNEKNRKVRATAIMQLGKYASPKYRSIFETAAYDSSYSVAGNALEALRVIDSSAALNIARKLASQPAKGKLAGALSSILVRAGDDAAAGIILPNFENLPFSQEKFDAIQSLTEFLMNVKNLNYFKRGIDDLINFEHGVPEAYQAQIKGFMDQVLASIKKAKAAAGQNEMAEYISSTQLKGF